MLVAVGHLGKKSFELQFCPFEYSSHSLGHDER